SGSGHGGAVPGLQMQNNVDTCERHRPCCPCLASTRHDRPGTLLCRRALLLGGEQLVSHGITTQIMPFAFLALVDLERHLVPLCGKAITAIFLRKEVACSNRHKVYSE